MTGNMVKNDNFTTCDYLLNNERQVLSTRQLDAAPGLGFHS